MLDDWLSCRSVFSKSGWVLKGIATAVKLIRVLTDEHNVKTTIHLGRPPIESTHSPAVNKCKKFLLGNQMECGQ